jgi:acyl-CoA synthetase (AMP-forming)/AMP-acid ligase II
VSAPAAVFPGLPTSVAERTVPQMLAAAVEQAGDRTALIAHSQISGREAKLSYRELSEAARRLAAILAERGVRRGDRVAILMDNDGAAEAHVAYHASHHLGAINVPINTLYVQRELDYASSFDDPAAIVFGSRFADVVAGLDLPRRPALLEATGGSPGAGEALGPLLERFDPHPSPAQAAEHDDADWIFTSGTTGHPKAVALTHANCVACGHQASRVWGLGPDSVYQNSSPFFTSTGCHTNLLPCLASRCAFVVDPEVDAQAIFDRAVRHGTTSMFALTAILAILLRRLDEGRLASLDAPSLRRLTYGGQTMPRSFHERLEQELTERRGVELSVVYGLTEGGTSGIWLVPEDHDEAVRRHGSYGLSIGRNGWNDWVAHRVVDEDGNDITPGEVGEIWLRAPSVMSRYVDDEEATARALSGGWLHTGDMATVDEAGFVYFVDRSKSMIRRGGINIAAAEVEAVAPRPPGRRRGGRGRAREPGARRGRPSHRGSR